MSMWTRLQPDYSANMWNEALNKRLGTEVSLLIEYYCTDYFVPISDIVVVLLNSLEPWCLYCELQ